MRKSTLKIERVTNVSDNPSLKTYWPLWSYLYSKKANTRYCRNYRSDMWLTDSVEQKWANLTLSVHIARHHSNANLDLVLQGRLRVPYQMIRQNGQLKLNNWSYFITTEGSKLNILTTSKIYDLIFGVSLYPHTLPFILCFKFYIFDKRICHITVW